MEQTALNETKQALMIRRQQSRTETRSFSNWDFDRDPKSILIIRFHAIGDVAITLPASVAVASLFPNAEVGFLTSEASVPLVRAITAFSNVYAIPSSSTRSERLKNGILTGLKMRSKRYDVVVDLQRNWQSRLIRRLAHAKSWGEFDRFSPNAASVRVLDTFHRTGFSTLTPHPALQLKNDLQVKAESLLVKEGWDSHSLLIVLNPAGFWETRNWSLDNYISLARCWLEHEKVFFVIVGTDRVSKKASRLKHALGDSLINLVNKTSLDEAMAIMRHANLIISEDSGLMHMAWAVGVPIVALFGSSNHVWSQPTGEYTRTFHSGDLECGACMSPTCRFDDVRCLTRVSPAMVFDAAQEILRNKHTTIAR
jgi:lipopolysaccharide heptosyltransferase II